MTRLSGLRALALIILTAAVAACTGSSSPAPSVRGSAIPTAEDSASIRATISLGYRERMRLGLGSPFRLIDFALNDPRLDSISRDRVAREILDGTLRGRGYQIDPVALDPILARPAPVAYRSGHLHLALIEATVAGAGNPRAGELAVRLGYGLAVTEGTIDSLALERAVHAAALVRDRELARSDARTLVRSARALGADPVQLIPAWRKAHRFAVERPLLAPVPSSIERAAIIEAPRVLERMRTAGLNLPGTAVPHASMVPPRSLLNAGSAAELARIADATNAPPSTAAVMAAYIASRERARFRASDGGAEQELSRDPLNEEQLVARYATPAGSLLRLRWSHAPVMLRAAVYLRSFAQESPWFPGFGGPSSAELQERYGVRVQFAQDVPEPWAPYYRAALDRSLTDLRRIVPAASVRGLTIRVTRVAESKPVLASHDPRERVLVWPATTGPGVLAHEIAHDLDWQANRRAYRDRKRRGYASTRAVSQQKAPLGPTLLSLAQELPAPHRSETLDWRRAHAYQPAEILARNFEWFVLSSLARQGRSNGHLSSAQDEVLTGHGSLRPPGESGAYGAAVLEAIQVLVPIPAEEQRAFAAAYGPGRPVTSSSLSRTLAKALAAGEVARDERSTTAGPRIHLAGIRTARDEALRDLEARSCRPPSMLIRRETIAEYRKLVVHAAAARGRAAALSLARDAGGADAYGWMVRELYGQPGSAGVPDSSSAVLVAGLAGEARALEQLPVPEAPEPFHLQPVAAGCRDSGPAFGW